MPFVLIDLSHLNVMDGIPDFKNLRVLEANPVPEGYTERALGNLSKKLDFLQREGLSCDINCRITRRNSLQIVKLGYAVAIKQ